MNPAFNSFYHPMASSSPPLNGKLNGYLVIGLVVVSIVVLISGAFAMGCCTWLRRQFLQELNVAEMLRWIPTVTYHNEEQWVGGEGGEATLECVICLSPFDEGEEVRRLPPCGHFFHVACIDMWLTSHNSCPVCRGIVTFLHFRQP